MKILFAVYGFFFLLLFGRIDAKRYIGLNPTNNTRRNYEVALNNVRLVKLHPDFFGPETVIKLESPNEYSFTINLLQNLPENSKSIHRAYEKGSRNEWFQSLTLKSTICDDFKKELQKMPIFQCIHLFEAGIRECPFKKGIYSATKVRCTSLEGPIMAPGRYWRINDSWVTEDQGVIMERLAELTITRKINW